jgi:cell volume regulation protein A
MVVRDGHAIVPERRMVLRRGDDLLVVTPRGQREPTVSRLRTVSEHGRLGQWLDD